MPWYEPAQCQSIVLLILYATIIGTGGGAFDLLVGHGHHISQVHYEGTDTETIRTDTTGTVVGVDYFDS